MSKLKALSKTSRQNYLTYGVVILAYIILQALERLSELLSEGSCWFPSAPMLSWPSP